MTPDKNQTTGSDAELLALAEQLRERTAMRYAGDCKCGKCQLVPREMIDKARDAILAIRPVGPASGAVGMLATCSNSGCCYAKRAIESLTPLVLGGDDIQTKSHNESPGHALNSESKSRWEPIETGPKDGRPVLLAFKDSDEEWCIVQGWYEAYVIDAQWYDVYHDPIHPVLWHPILELPASPTDGDVA